MKKHIALALIIATLFSACKDDPEIEVPPVNGQKIMGGPTAPPQVSSFTIGQTYLGGIIFYIDQTGEHGLIAAPFDQSASIRANNGSSVWWNSGRPIGNGWNNTNNTVMFQGSGNYAANIVFKKNINGYSDWYLPSYDELVEMYWRQNKIPGMSGGKYWSSSEFGIDEAIAINFGLGWIEFLSKSQALRVRAVKSF